MLNLAPWHTFCPFSRMLGARTQDPDCPWPYQDIWEETVCCEVKSWALDPTSGFKAWGLVSSSARWIINPASRRDSAWSSLCETHGTLGSWRHRPQQKQGCVPLPSSSMYQGSVLYKGDREPGLVTELSTWRSVFPSAASVLRGLGKGHRAPGQLA